MTTHDLDPVEAATAATVPGRSVHRSTAAAVGRSVPRSAWALVALGLSGSSVSVMQTLALPLVPLLPERLGVSTSEASWIVTSTALAGVLATPIAGRLGDMFGKRAALLICLLVSTAGSVGCALVTTLFPLVLGRAAQGASMAALPLAISLVRDSVAPHRVNLGVGIVGGSVSFGSVLGLIVGGTVLHAHSHQLLFLMAAVTSGISLALVGLLVPVSARGAGGSFPIRATALSSAGLLVVLLALSQGNQWGWTSGRTLGGFGLGMALFVVWGATEGVRPGLGAPARYFRTPMALTNLVATAVGFGMLVNMLATMSVLAAPSANGAGFGFSSLRASLGLIPGLLVSVLFSQISSRLATSRGPTVPVLVGCVTLAIGFFVRAAELHSAAWTIAGATISYTGVGLSFGALPMLVMTLAPVDRTATANSVNFVFRGVGTAVASATIAAVLSIFTLAPDDPTPSRMGYRVVFLVSGLVSLAAVATSAYTRRTLAAGARPSRSQQADSRGWTGSELVP